MRPSITHVRLETLDGLRRTWTIDDPKAPKGRIVIMPLVTDCRGRYLSRVYRPTWSPVTEPHVMLYREVEPNAHDDDWRRHNTMMDRP